MVEPSCSHISTKKYRRTDEPAAAQPKASPPACSCWAGAAHPVRPPAGRPSSATDTSPPSRRSSGATRAPLGRYAAGDRRRAAPRTSPRTPSRRRCWRCARDSDSEIELRPWLYRIVRNTALNDLRDRPRHGRAGRAARRGRRSAAEQFERREEVAGAAGPPRALPDAQRAAIVMRELEGLGHEEIADCLGDERRRRPAGDLPRPPSLRDGVGMLIPLPLRRILSNTAGSGRRSGRRRHERSRDRRPAAAPAAAGAGTALKVGVVTAVLAGSVGTGAGDQGS